MISIETEVEIAYAFPVYITIGEQTQELEFTGGTVLEALEAAGYKLESAEKTKVPQNTVELTSEDDIKFMGLLLEKLEDDDDVMNVYHNWEMPEE